MIKPGDQITFAGVYAVMRNPARRWWQSWKPRFVSDPRVPAPGLAVFKVVA